LGPPARSRPGRPRRTRAGAIEGHDHRRGDRDLPAGRHGLELIHRVTRRYDAGGAGRTNAMRQYLPSIHQPDGAPPPPEVLSKVMRDVDALIAEIKASGSWV